MLKLNGEFSIFGPMYINRDFPSPGMLKSLDTFPRETISVEEFTKILSEENQLFTEEFAGYFFWVTSILFADAKNSDTRVRVSHLKLIAQLQLLKSPKEARLGHTGKGQASLDDTIRGDSTRPEKQRNSVANCFRGDFRASSSETARMFGVGIDGSRVGTASSLEVEMTHFVEVCGVSNKAMTLPGGENLSFRDCNGCHFILEHFARFVQVKNCQNCEFFIPAAWFFMAEQSAGLAVNVAAGLVSLCNVNDTSLGVYSPRRPVLAGEIKKVSLGPFASSWAGLPDLFRRAQLAFDKPSIENFRRPLEFFRCQALGDPKNAFELLGPAGFEMFAGPQGDFMSLKVALTTPGLGTLLAPFASLALDPLLAKAELPIFAPHEFILAETEKWKIVHKLRKTIEDKGLSSNEKAAFDSAVLGLFKDWMRGPAKQTKAGYFRFLTTFK